MDILDLIKSAFLGLVEGITEWLPISSTGHMILVEEFVKMNVSEEFWNMFLVVIQLGAILSVVVLYFHDLNPFSPSKGAEGRRATWTLWGKIILGCIPAAVIGLPLNDFMDEHFYNGYVVAVALVVYGIAFIIIENWRAHKRSERALGVRMQAPKHGRHFAGAAPVAQPADDDTDFGASRASRTSRGRQRLASAVSRCFPSCPARPAPARPSSAACFWAPRAQSLPSSRSTLRFPSCLARACSRS